VIHCAAIVRSLARRSPEHQRRGHRRVLDFAAAAPACGALAYVTLRAAIARASCAKANSSSVRANPQYIRKVQSRSEACPLASRSNPRVHPAPSIIVGDSPHRPSRPASRCVLAVEDLCPPPVAHRARFPDACWTSSRSISSPPPSPGSLDDTALAPRPPLRWPSRQRHHSTDSARRRSIPRSEPRYVDPLSSALCGRCCFCFVGRKTRVLRDGRAYPRLLLHAHAVRQRQLRAPLNPRLCAAGAHYLDRLFNYCVAAIGPQARSAQ